MIARLLPIAALLLAACGQFPKDPDGTLNRVKAERSFRVGLVSSGDRRVGAGLESALLQRISAATGASPVIVEGPAEPLLTDLEQGRLDLVTGPLSPDSPWATRVTLIRPLGEQVTPWRHALITPIARNGENAWIMLLEREARAVAAGEEQP